MHVEPCCQALLSIILPEIDPQCQGLAIDVGVGTFAFYCELFDRLNFKSIAVEPLPTKQLRKICYARNILLLETCISEIDGMVNLHIGSFKGSENLNLNSMLPTWWGSSANTKQVPSRQLLPLIDQLTSQLNTQQITILKLDVEGVEFSIINQLAGLQRSCLPAILMFEYGGGSILAAGDEGWSEELLQQTMKSLEVLRNLGYKQAIVIDAAAGFEERLIDLQTTTLQVSNFFSAESVYGNIIVLRDVRYPVPEIRRICQNYRDNDVSPPSLMIQETIWKQISLKFRELIYQASVVTTQPALTLNSSPKQGEGL